MNPQNRKLQFKKLCLVWLNTTRFFGFNPILGPIFGFKLVKQGWPSGSKNRSNWAGLTSKRVQIQVQPYNVLHKSNLNPTLSLVGFIWPQALTLSLDIYLNEGLLVKNPCYNIGIGKFELTLLKEDKKKSIDYFILLNDLGLFRLKMTIFTTRKEVLPPVYSHCSFHVMTSECLT